MKSPDKSMVCIVRLINGVQHPAVRNQVTLLPENVKDEFIRIGNTAGDELVGWFLLEDLVLVKVLGTPTADGKGFINEEGARIPGPYG